MIDLQFEVGKHYRLRCGDKMTVLMIENGYVFGRIDGAERPEIWTPRGFIHSVHLRDHRDIVAEWRDKARVRVTMARHRASGYMRVWKSGELPIPGRGEDYEVLDTFELVEGEGLE